MAASSRNGCGAAPARASIIRGHAADPLLAGAERRGLPPGVARRTGGGLESELLTDDTGRAVSSPSPNSSRRSPKSRPLSRQGHCPSNQLTIFPAQGELFVDSGGWEWGKLLSVWGWGFDRVACRGDADF